MSDHDPLNEGNARVNSHEIRTAWSDAAGDLSRWTMDRLVVRCDVWGGYVREDERGKEYTDANGKSQKLGSTITRPARSRRGKVFLTEDFLRQHFAPRHAGDVIGLHTTSSRNTCRWGAVDIDKHGDGVADPQVNLRAALHWYDCLAARGFRPLLTDSNGRGGYHLRALFAGDLPADRAFWFFRGLVADAARLGLAATPETFPKQSRLKPDRYGNWMRVPGRHHSHDHWSRVWDGQRWLEGAEAIRYLMMLTGDPTELVPDDVEVDARVRLYRSKFPNLGEGQGRDDVAFQFLAWLARDMKLADDAALNYAAEWDANNIPPKGRDRLAEVLANVHQYGQRQYGSGTSTGTPSSCDSNTSDDRPMIVITVEESEVNCQAAQALSRDAGTYQRGGLLVRVLRDASPAAHGIRRPYAPRIEPLPPALLRERLSACARWITLRETDEGVAETPARPPAWSVAAVHARADWPCLRYLEAVVEYPVLRPDGSILCRPGYDPTTGLLLDLVGQPPEIPECPSHADAEAARDQLLEIIADFPMEQEAHRAAWLAALLTPLARFAYTGPSPLFLIDANVRGAGKGLLVDTIATVVTGQRATVAAYTSDDDEMRKRITALVLSGDRLVLLDNLEGKFGSPVLDAALTAVSWKDRLLGANRVVEAPMVATWYATGNNVAVAADTARRVCHIRLESPEEQPEMRQGFRHPNLVAWVSENRSRLLVAGLTLLSAYFRAGRPDMKLPAWGSFEGWSNLVRGAVVWAGMADPGETRLLLQRSADVTAECMATLLKAWERMDPKGRGLTSAEVIDKLKNPPSPTPDWYADLRDAVEGLVGRMDARALGFRLRSYRRRVFAGRFLDQAGREHRAARWVVRPASAFRRGGTADPGEHKERSGEASSAGHDEHDPASADRGDAWEGDGATF